MRGLCVYYFWLVFLGAVAEECLSTQSHNVIARPLAKLRLLAQVVAMLHKQSQIVVEFCPFIYLFDFCILLIQLAGLI